MPSENECRKILEEICEKLNKIDTLDKNDVLEIKKSASAIEKLAGGIKPSADMNEKIQDLINEVHSALLKCMQDTAKHAEAVPNIDDITAVITDLNNIQGRNIKQVNVVIKEIQAELLKMHSDFQSRDFFNNISKISDIYERLNALNSLMNKMAASYDDLEELQQKVDIIYDNINTLNNWTAKIDKLDLELPEIKSALNPLFDIKEEIKTAKDAVNSLKADFNESSGLSADIDLEDLSNKIDIVYENLTALNSWADKFDAAEEKASENSKDIASIKENIGSVSDSTAVISDKVNNLTDAVKAVSDSIRSISEDIGIASIKENIDSISDSTAVISDKVNILTDAAEAVSDSIRSISEDIGVLSGKINNISDKTEKLDNYGESNQVSDLSKKMDDVLNGIVSLDEKSASAEAVNSISERIEKISVSSSDIINSASKISEKLETAAEKQAASDEKLDNINRQNEFMSDKIIELSDKIEEIKTEIKTEMKISEAPVLEFSEKIDALSSALSNTGIQNSIDAAPLEEVNENIEHVSDKINELFGTTAGIDEKTDSLKDELNVINKNTELLSGKISELVYTSAGIDENASAAAGKIDALSENITHVSDKINELFGTAASIDEKTETAGRELSEKIDEKFSSLSNKINVLAESIAEDASKEDNANLYEDDFADVNENIEHVSDKINELFGTAASIDEKTDGLAEQIENRLEEKLSSLSERINALAENISDNVAASIAAKAEDAALYEDKFTGVNENIEQVSDKINELFGAAAGIDEKNETANKELNEKIEEKFAGVNENIEHVSDKINELFGAAAGIDEKTETANKELNEKIEEKFTGVNENIEHVSNKVNELLGSVLEVSDRVSDTNGNIQTAVSDTEAVSAALNEFSEQITDKVDVIYDNIGLLNQWVNKIDDLTHSSRLSDERRGAEHEHLSEKISAVRETLQHADDIISSVPAVKAELDMLVDEFRLAAGITAESDTGAPEYTLIDIESDFLKLYKFIDNAVQVTSDDISALKERFSELNDDMTSVSIRTNKLLLSADEIYKTFKTSVDALNQTVQSFDDKTSEFEPEVKYNLLDSKLDEISITVHSTAQDAENLNKAFNYLTEWIDAAGAVLKDIQQDTSVVSELKTLHDQLAQNVTQGIRISSEQLKETLKQEFASDKFEIMENIRNSASAAADEIRNGTAVISSAAGEIFKAFNDFKENDAAALKNAVTFIGNKLEETAPAVLQLEASIDKSFKELQLNSAERAEALKQSIDAARNSAETFRSDAAKLIADLKENDIQSVKDALMFLVQQSEETPARAEEMYAGIEKSFNNLKEEDIKEIKSLLAAIIAKAEAAAKRAEEISRNSSEIFEDFKTNDAAEIKGISRSAETKADEAVRRIEDFKTAGLTELIEIKETLSDIETKSDSSAAKLEELEQSASKKFEDFKNEDIKEIKAVLSLIAGRTEAYSARTEELFSDLKTADAAGEKALQNAASEVSALISSKAENIDKSSSKLEEIQAAILKSFDDFKTGDLNTVKEALTFLINKADEYDIPAGIESIETAVNKSAEENSRQLKEISEGADAKIKALENRFDNFKEYQDEEFSDIKSALNGIMLQLNTALAPHIDSLNERIDRLADQNAGSLSKLETLMQEKINLQSKYINALETKLDKLSDKYSGITAKFDEMSTKYDNLALLVKESADNTEIKNILNYITSQTALVNENTAAVQNNQQNNSEMLGEVLKNTETNKTELADISKNLSILSIDAANIGENITKAARADKLQALAETLAGINKNTAETAQSVYAIKALSEKTAQTADNIENGLNENISKAVQTNELVNDLSEKIDDFEESISKAAQTNELVNDLSEKIDEFDENISKAAQTNDLVNDLSEKIEDFDENISKAAEVTMLIQSLYERVSDFSENITEAVNDSKILNQLVSKLSVLEENSAKTDEISMRIKTLSEKTAAFEESISKAAGNAKVLNVLAAKISSFDENASKTLDSIELLEKLSSRVSEIAESINNSADNSKLLEEIAERTADFEEYTAKAASNAKILNVLVNKISALDDSIKNRTDNSADNSEILQEITERLAGFELNLSKAAGSAKALNALSDKLSGFDSDIKKIVSYIEEE